MNYMNTRGKNKISKKRLLSIIAIMLSSALLLACIIGFTVCNYLIHSAVGAEHFAIQEVKWSAANTAKGFIFKGQLSVDEATLNAHLQSIIKKSPVIIGDYKIEDIAAEIKEDKQVLYIKYSKSGKLKLLTTELDIEFNVKKRTLEAEIKEIKIGQLEIPDFLSSKYLNNIFPYKNIFLSGNKIILPLDTVEAHKQLNFDIQIKSIEFSDGNITINTDKPFAAEQELIYNIFGEKTETIISTIIDEFIEGCDNITLQNILNGCLSEFSRSHQLLP